MTKQISLTISKILNWSTEQKSCRVEVAFYGATSGAYISHKTTLGYSSSQAFILNTSFKISYSGTEHLISCKITNLQSKNGSQLIGNIEIDLQVLKQRSLLFIPFQDHDKVLEVKLYEPRKDEDSNQTETKHQREQFLQQRYAFMNKIAYHDAELKKKFSQRVYNFLKQLKNRNVGDNLPERQIPLSHLDHTKSTKIKNQLDFRSRLNDQRRKLDIRNTETFSNQDPKSRMSPIKRKNEENLLLESMKEKSPRDKKQRGYQYEDIQIERGYSPREDRYLSRPERNELEINSKKGAFGGLLQGNDRSVD